MILINVYCSHFDTFYIIKVEITELFNSIDRFLKERNMSQCAYSFV